jgi:hypothetical protein
MWSQHAYSRFRRRPDETVKPRRRGAAGGAASAAGAGAGAFASHVIARNEEAHWQLCGSFVLACRRASRFCVEYIRRRSPRPL